MMRTIIITVSLTLIFSVSAVVLYEKLRPKHVIETDKIKIIWDSDGNRGQTSGVVFDRQFRPVAGQILHFHNDSGGDVCATDIDGRFRIVLGEPDITGLLVDGVDEIRFNIPNDRVRLVVVLNCELKQTGINAPVAGGNNSTQPASQPKTDTDNGVAQVAQMANTLPSPKDEVVKMLKDLESKDVNVRDAAGQKMVMYTDYGASEKALIPEMLRIFNSREDVKYPILCAFCQMGPNAKDALPDIRKCLTHHDKAIRALAEEAIRAIENTGKNETVPYEIPPSISEVVDGNTPTQPASQPQTGVDEGSKK